MKTTMMIRIQRNPAAAAVSHTHTITQREGEREEAERERERWRRQRQETEGERVTYQFTVSIIHCTIEIMQLYNCRIIKIGNSSNTPRWPYMFYYVHKDNTMIFEVTCATGECTVDIFITFS